ncbi:MAG: hypothetical protein AAF797_14855 [Planctomycetota bacterium]
MFKKARDRRRRTRELEKRQALAASQQDGPNLYDPIEDDPEFVQIIAEADRLTDLKLHGANHFGSCHEFWETKQAILKERFGIEWFSPNDMNPLTLFD